MFRPVPMEAWWWPVNRSKHVTYISPITICCADVSSQFVIYSEEKLWFVTNLEKMFKCKGAGVDAHSRQWRRGDWFVTQELPGSCVMADAVLTIRAVRSSSESTCELENQGSNVAAREEVHWCEVRWPGGPSHTPAHFSPTIDCK